MKFIKMHGCGNSYIYMDVRGKNLSDEYLGALSEKVADKNKGIGSDGLIVLDDSQVADGRMRMYNADGSEGAMCGNGIRCLAKLMYERAGIRKDELVIETKSGIKTVKVVLEDGIVTGATVDMGCPDFESSHIPVVTETGVLGRSPVSPAAGNTTAVGGKNTAAQKKTTGKPASISEEEKIILPEEDEPLSASAAGDRTARASALSGKEQLLKAGGAEKKPADISIVLEDDDEIELPDRGKEEKSRESGGNDPEKCFINQSILIKNGDGDIEDFTVTCVSMGNPHAVTFVEQTDRDDFALIGPEFENNTIFPDRINTEFVKKIDRSHVKMRVWERGSGETMACGTGACATVAAGVKTGRLDTSVEVEMTGGTLKLFYDTETGHIYMTGEAVEICEGELI